LKKLKKPVFVCVLALMLSFYSISQLAFNATAETDLPVHNIDSGLNYETIQEAIDANETLDGHRISVDPGMYYEHVVVDKSVSLIGENSLNTFIDGNDTGTVIYVSAGGVNITGFTVQNGGETTGGGIHVEASVGVNISHNVIRNNFRGIFMKDSSKTTVTNNEVLNSEYGIRLFYSTNNLFRNLKISNNSRGFYLGYSDGNVVSNSMVLNCEEGIRMFTSKNNVIFHNNLINNTVPAISVDSLNFWDNGLEGNFWNNYEGIDENQDGIGDTPFIIDGNNTDSFPLMGTFSSFNVIYEHEPYGVTIVCNSTVYGFSFDLATMMLKFNITGMNNTVSFSRILFSKVLVNWPYVVLVDNEQINSTVLPLSNYTHAFLYFTYTLDGHEVGITSKPYYQLLVKYNIVLSEYQELNSTYYQLVNDYSELLTNFQILNASYQGLLAQYHNLNVTYYELLTSYNGLNATYYEVLDNYTVLQSNYDTLNSSYTELQGSYDMLNSTYNTLLANCNTLNASFNEYKQTHSYSDSEYDAVVTDRDYWIMEYDTLNATYHSLQANHTDLQADYSSLQTVFNSLNSTYGATVSELDYVRNLMYIFLATTAGLVVLASFSLRYYRMFNRQKRLLERYERELKRLSPLETARILFKADVERREATIGRFEEKYGVKVRPRRTLEDAIKSLELKKKEDEK